MSTVKDTASGGPSAAVTAIDAGKLVFFGNEFPNDDLKDLFRRLYRQSKDRRFRQLSAFLEEVTSVLKKEVSLLPQPMREVVPHFDSVCHLIEHGDFRNTPLGAAMESVFLTTLQLGMFIGHYEAEGLAWEAVQSRIVLAGLSIGLFSAAAVALSSSLSDLVQNAAETLRVSWRLGVFVADFSRKLEAPQPDGSLQSWAHVVPGMTQDAVQQELNKFNKDTGSPELTKVFISAADKSSIGVTGPPSQLKAAFQHSGVLRYAKSFPLPVYDGVCHASHVYSDSDVDEIIEGSESALQSSTIPVRVALLSTCTGKPYPSATAAELYRDICKELITGTIYMDDMTDNIVLGLSNMQGMNKCYIQSFRTSLILRNVTNAIKSALTEAEVSNVDFLDWAFKEYGARRAATAADAKLAIVGMACRMPGGADDLDKFWELISSGRDTHTTIPESRFDLATHYDPTGKTENATQTPYGNFLQDPGHFDAAFFQMSPREAEQTCPMQRLALVTAYEALEMAGTVSGRTASSDPSRIGTYYGQASDDWRELNASQNIGTYAVPGGERAFANGRINYFMKFSGPSLNIDTACSSSAAAINAACSALWAGEVDTAIAGGLNVITDPDNYAGLCNAFFLSKTGQCKVWDKDADGYCRAEAVASVVIKRLEDAEADNDKILAVVLSAKTNHSADAISITHPHAGAQESNYRNTVYRAGINPLDVGYVEMHGTGTQAGDAAESQSVLSVFAPATHGRKADQPLLLGAVKSNVGHSEAAAGITSLIKALLVFQNGMVPRHIGIKTEVNPAIPKDLARRQVTLPLENAAWPRPVGKKRTALVNSFGAHGGNTTILLEDGPEVEKLPLTGDRTSHAFTISAKSKNSLVGNIQNLLSYLEKNPSVNLADLSYTSCSRRLHHSLRLGTTVSNISQLKKFLETSAAKLEVKGIPMNAPSVVFTFTGQSGSLRGKRQELLDQSPYFRSQVSQLDRIVQRLGFPSIMPILEGTAEETADSPVLSQLSIVVLEIALAHYWFNLGIRPAAVVGHSLGEYSALAIAGCISFAEALNIVGRRAQLTEKICKAGSHSMLSVRATPEAIQTAVEAEKDAGELVYEITCINSHADTVIGGDKDIIGKLRLILERLSFKCTLLELPYAFHTAQMDVILEDLGKIASGVHFKAPSVPVISPIMGSVIFDGKTANAEYLKRHTRETVNFAAAIDAAHDMGIVDEKTMWVDIGPHPVCTAFVRSLIPEARVAASCRRNEDNLTTIAKSLIILHLAGVPVKWNEFYKPDEASLSLLTLPKYSWNNTNYWIPYLGTWTLDKAKLKYGEPEKPVEKQNVAVSTFRTSLIHTVVEETVSAEGVYMRAISDMQQGEFFESIWGHQMNGCGVATSSIWSDMVLSAGEHLYKLLVPNAKDVHMRFQDFEVLHAQIASKTPGISQLLELEAQLDAASGTMTTRFFNVDSTTGKRHEEHFASGLVSFEDPSRWTAEWSRVEHLILGRIDALDQLAATGKASRLNKNMAYTLFKNVVDYADRYRGIDDVVINDHEAFANITLTNDRHGSHHTPPHWIDSVCHLAGLIMNGSDASNTRDYFYVTPGCESFRLHKPLEAGGKYRSYVRMFQLPSENFGGSIVYGGDVYIFQGDTVVGMVGQIRFRRVPRMLMDRFFIAPDAKTSTSHAAPVAALKPASTVAVAAFKKDAPPVPIKKAQLSTPPASIPITPQRIDITPSKQQAKPRFGPVEPLTPPSEETLEKVYPEPIAAAAPATPAPSVTEITIEAPAGVAGHCLQVIARETNLPMESLADEAAFADLGIDSLLSLVLAEKFRAEVGIEIKSSLFLECPTIGEMKAWLTQNC